MRKYVVLALSLSALALSAGAPALAQSFSPGYGTGNVSGSARLPGGYVEPQHAQQLQRPLYNVGSAHQRTHHVRHDRGQNGGNG